MCKGGNRQARQAAHARNNKTKISNIQAAGMVCFPLLPCFPRITQLQQGLFMPLDAIREPGELVKAKGSEHMLSLTWVRFSRISSSLVGSRETKTRKHENPTNMHTTLMNPWEPLTLNMRRCLAAESFGVSAQIDSGVLHSGSERFSVRVPELMLGIPPGQFVVSKGNIPHTNTCSSCFFFSGVPTSNQGHRHLNGCR